LRRGAHEKVLSGADPATTNNRMELLAAIEALRALKRPSRVRITTDSQYVRQGVTEWVKRWKANGWKTTQKQPVKNKDLWEALTLLAEAHEIEWCWVKGHSGHPENDLVDATANAAIDRLLAGSLAGT
jgi:ribonuclease HI